MFYTSYFSNIGTLPKDMVLISISRKPPAWWKGWSLKSLAPSESLLGYWHRTHNADEYVARYAEEVLWRKDADLLVENLRNKFGDKDICFLCFEKSGFCHRHLVAKWLSENGYACREWRA